MNKTKYSDFEPTLLTLRFYACSEGVQKKDNRGGTNIRIANLYRYRKGYIRYSVPPYSIHRIAVSKRQDTACFTERDCEQQDSGRLYATLAFRVALTLSVHFPKEEVNAKKGKVSGAHKLTT
jgi:hypothetical protein